LKETFLLFKKKKRRNPLSHEKRKEGATTRICTVTRRKRGKKSSTERRDDLPSFIPAEKRKEKDSFSIFNCGEGLPYCYHFFLHKEDFRKRAPLSSLNNVEKEEKRGGNLVL